MTQSISVIIPTVGEKSLIQALNAVVPQLTDTDELIVVGRFCESLSSRFPSVKFIPTNSIISPGAARNIGMTYACGDIFLFTDSDCVPTNNWVSGHRFHQSQNQKIVGGGVILNHHHFLALADNVSMFHEFSSTQPKTKKHRLPSCNLSVHRSVWDHLGGFDESLPRGEDSDWTLKMSQNGYPIFFFPDLSIQHLTERSTPKDIFNHWLESGKHNVQVRKKFTSEYNHPSWIYSPWFLTLFSPLIALFSTLKIFLRPNNLFYVSTLPLVFLTKLFYCWGGALSTKKI